MAALNFLKKAACRPAVFLCILSTGSASVSLGRQPAGTLHSGDVKTIGPDTADFPLAPLIGPSAPQPEKVESCTPAHAPRPAPPDVIGGVTARWYGPDRHDRTLHQRPGPGCLLNASAKQFGFVKLPPTGRGFPARNSSVFLRPLSPPARRGLRDALPVNKEVTKRSRETIWVAGGNQNYGTY